MYNVKMAGAFYVRLPSLLFRSVAREDGSLYVPIHMDLRIHSFYVWT